MPAADSCERVDCCRPRRDANLAPHRAQFTNSDPEHLCPPVQDRRHHGRRCYQGDNGGNDPPRNVIMGLGWQSGGDSGFVRWDGYAKCLRCRRWRRGRVAEGGGLLNRYTLLRRIEGSNPSVSAREC
jgi:hypothetical protein